MGKGTTMQCYRCQLCGYVYDEARGLPGEGHPPGTPWDDLPRNWTCPECGATRKDFEPLDGDPNALKPEPDR